MSNSTEDWIHIVVAKIRIFGEKILGQNCFWSTKFGKIRFLIKRKFLVKKIFRSKKVFEQKNVLLKKCFGQTLFWSNEIFN